MRVILTENQIKNLILEKKKTKKEEKKEKKDKFDRISFYLDFYKNLTPDEFDICKKGDEIIITIPNKK
tara:strand:- start:275 stop:478 length:204 start_codon:yes stop_codon:yes gene_type:complete